MAPKKKFYSVAVGRSTGVFTDWASAETQVKGFAGAKYKSFATETEAREWLADPVYRKATGAGKPTKTKTGKAASPVVDIPEDAVVVHTDGGAIGNPGPGGYGVVIIQEGKRVELSGGYKLTTNNRMEMTAAIVALERLQGCQQPIILFSDSSYLVNGISKGWVRNWSKRGWRKSDGGPVMNVDLWKKILQFIENLNVEFHWLKGHAGHEENERCDQLAVAAARGAKLVHDVGYERSLETLV